MTTLHKDNQDVNTETQDQAPLPSAKELRESFEGVIQSTADQNRELSEMVKVIDLGDAKKMITDTMLTLASMSRKKEEGAATRFLRKFGMGKAVDKVKDEATTTSIEGKSVASVSQELLTNIQNKKKRVDDVFGKLVGLRDSMRDGYVQMKAMVDGINSHMEDFNDEERYYMVTLKAEVLESMEYQKDNILSAQGGIKAAETAATQFSQMIPKLRAQINDAMVIRGALSELEDLTAMVTVVDEACQELRTENREVMEESLMGILDRSTVSDKHLALIESNNSKQVALQNKLADKYKEVEARKAVVVEKLEQSNNASQHLLGLSGGGAKI